jgi:hypothetical protein
VEKHSFESAGSVLNAAAQDLRFDIVLEQRRAAQFGDVGSGEQEVADDGVEFFERDQLGTWRFIAPEV